MSRSIIPFRAIAIVHDLAELDHLVAVARARSNLGFGLLLRDAGHRSEHVELLLRHVSERHLPENVTKIAGSPGSSHAGWRHLSSADLRVEHEDDASSERARLMQGASVHDAGELDLAVAIGCSYVLASPVFPTASKPGAPTLGIAGFADLCARSSIPVFALGGVVDAERAAACLEAGAYGIAGISLFASSSRSDLDAVLDLVAERTSRESSETNQPTIIAR